MGKRGPRGVAPQILFAFACQWYWLFRRAEEGFPEGCEYYAEITKIHHDGTCDFDWIFTSRLGKRGEPEIWSGLLNAVSAEEVRSLCERSPWHLNPKYGGGPGSPYPGLPALADSFLRAKKHRRYPCSTGRPTSDDARKWFLAVALAAESHGIGLGRGINLLQSDRSLTKPEEPQWWREAMDSTEGVIELVHPNGNYYTDGRTYWRVPKDQKRDSKTEEISPSFE